MLLSLLFLLVFWTSVTIVSGSFVVRVWHFLILQMGEMAPWCGG